LGDEGEVFMKLKLKRNANLKDLEWFLDFSEMDLVALSDVKKGRLLDDLSYFCSDAPLKWDRKEFQQTADLMTEEELRALREIDSEGNLVEPGRIQEHLREFLEQMDQIQEERKGRSDRVSERLIVADLPRVDSYVVSPGMGRFETPRRPTEPTPENWLITNFI
jgi:hypothetical protein